MTSSPSAAAESSECGNAVGLTSILDGGQFFVCTTPNDFKTKINLELEPETLNRMSCLLYR